MAVSDLIQSGGEWLRGVGDMHEVVISSRVRLARNIAGMSFLTRCTDEQKAEIVSRIREETVTSSVGEDAFYVDLSGADPLERELLVERHLISRQHAEADHPRGALIRSNETMSIMVNEEDHLRVQVLRSGLQLEDAVEEIGRIDDILENRLEFAFHRKYGYLTACPTNVGTGLRVSVMLHLPALKMTGEIEKAFRAARDMRLAIRGLFGEGTEATGDFFQVSNQTTLGKSEEQIVDEFLGQTVPGFIEYEQRARESLVENRALAVDDKIYRALAILQSTRMISSEETMYLLSLVRLGVNLERLKGVDIQTVNELFLLTQPAHLQTRKQMVMDPNERAGARAELIRKRLENLSTN
jgi:protein arginine kinase